MARASCSGWSLGNNVNCLEARLGEREGERRWTLPVLERHCAILQCSNEQRRLIKCPQAFARFHQVLDFVASHHKRQRSVRVQQRPIESFAKPSDQRLSRKTLNLLRVGAIWLHGQAFDSLTWINAQHRFEVLGGHFRVDNLNIRGSSSHQVVERTNTIYSSGQE
jgi:hypothetical protein